MIAKGGFILILRIAILTGNRHVVLMLMLYVSVYCCFVDPLFTKLTLNLVGICKQSNMIHWKSFWDCRTPCAILSCSFRLHLVLKDFSHKLQTDGSVMVCLAEMCRGRFLLDKTVPQCGHSARSDFPVTEQTWVQVVFICKFHVLVSDGCSMMLHSYIENYNVDTPRSQHFGVGV